ncbi:nucleotidyl transferase AbiEii/AbiGii toxin family protein [Botryobacter ruber]|uniref:nucleotidyl transferase AbiEii/AbiGii toxin family protein n=1 Tax=Botryobacter ruber TaxID=2171629 RepID=UPI000E0A1A00|nr:nucleotidyl transferase AbiEii/AbiGii toxin family protein [Botryobacter ruber]
MKDTSKISYEALMAPGLKEILGQVSVTCKAIGVDFFMVGAIARNVWFASHEEASRGTKDIDFAVYIPDISKYNQLRERLLADYGYRDSTENAYCLLSPNGNQVDLLPFGEIESEGKVMIQGKGLVSINLDGFREVFEQGLEKVRLGEELYAVCNIASVIILKLVAFDDRPEHRLKDLLDIAGILQSYPYLEDEHIWSKHFDLYESERSHEDVAMIGLGREMRKIVETNEKLHARLKSILKKGITGESRLADHMVLNSKKEGVEQKRHVLKNLLQGLDF